MQIVEFETNWITGFYLIRFRIFESRCLKSNKFEISNHQWFYYLILFPSFMYPIFLIPILYQRVPILEDIRALIHVSSRLFHNSYFINYKYIIQIFYIN